MALHVLICVVFITGLSGPAITAPYVPASDSQVLERLPFKSGDPAMRELRALHSQLTREPDNLPLTLRLAQGYLELGRVTGDPRYAGYAEAALAPWWHLQQAPRECCWCAPRCVSACTSSTRPWRIWQLC
jgi:hypothetical protein